MSYLDELSALFGDDIDTNEGSETIPARTTLETVREQLEESSLFFVEGPEGHFVSNGGRRGCGFATVEVDVDEQAGTCTFDINTHLRVAPENARPVRRLMCITNSILIQTGLVLSDDGIVHFTPEEPIDVRGGDDIAVAVARGFITVHDNAWKFTAIAAGTPAWEFAEA